MQEGEAEKVFINFFSIDILKKKNHPISLYLVIRTQEEKEEKNDEEKEIKGDKK